MPKSSVQRVVLGEVALNSTRVSSDPVADGFERYIIGKHIPEGDFRVTEWNYVGDADFGPRIRTIFEEGDVICTTRGPKIKVARVDFGGLCAHTNFVLRTRDPEVLLQPFLEAVIRSDGFQQHLRTNFRGSVNLFVNWSDAAKYEFALPPLNDQRSIVRTVAQAQEAAFAQRHVLDRAIQVLDSAGHELFRGLESIPCASLASLSLKSPQSGIYKPASDEDGDVHFVQMGELFGNDYIHAESCARRVTLTPAELLKFGLADGDLLFGRRSIVLSGAGRCVIVRGGLHPTTFESSLLRVRTDPARLLPEFAFEWFRSPLGVRRIGQIVTFTTVAGIKGSDLAKQILPVPSLRTQQEIIDVLHDLRGGVAACENHVNKAMDLATRIHRDLLRAYVYVQ